MTNLLHKEDGNGQIQPIFICFTFYMVLELLSMKQDAGAIKKDKIYVKRLKMVKSSVFNKDNHWTTCLYLLKPPLNDRFDKIKC